MPEPIPRLNAALEGRYRVERELGQGGMATVYLAEDLRHEREVALKVLKPELAAVVGAERFLAEIKTTANLQHPHILALHDSGEVNGTVFYVMPFVEGESLRDRLNREKQLPVREAVRIAAEVAGALAYAHGKGVIHRDIKPENILLHAGQALVADFGIALAAAKTGSDRITETGMSLGTPHYMSPEQAMGERDLDARSDVYALGCVLHEMLVGEPPFTGPTAQSIVAKVMTEDPTPATEIRKTVPPHVEDAILTALAKLPADRFSGAAELEAALEAEGTGGLRRGMGARRTTAPLRGRILWPVGFAIAAGLAAWGWLRPAPTGEQPPPTRLAVVLPNLGGNATSLQRQLALTPDGSTLLYTAIAPDGENRTMVRVLDEAESTILQGIEPFVSGYAVSQDGREFVGSLRDSQRMFRYSITGGTPRPLPREVSWTPVVAWDASGALWLSDRSNPERGVARLDRDGDLTYPVVPDGTGIIVAQILPGDRTALAQRQPIGTSSGAVLLLDLETGRTTVLIDRPVVEVRYTAGHLVYVLQDGTMEAVAFDPSSLRMLGRAVTVAEGVWLTGSGVAQFDVSHNGTVTFIPEEPRSLVFVDRQGAVRPATSEGHNFHHPRFSPDGRSVAVDFNSADGRDVWLLSLDDGVLTRATLDRDGHDATWAPDGRTLLYTSAPDGEVGTYRTRPGSGERELLFTSPQLGYTGIWLRDQSAIVTAGNSLTENGLGDIGILRNGGHGPLEPIAASRFVEQYPAVSPDDRWVAYASGRSGRNEVYVRPLAGGDPVQVSLSGGIEPVWGPHGRELFYRTDAGPDSDLAVATVVTDPLFRVADRDVLFPVPDMATATPHANYDVSPDGQTFVMVRYNPASRITVIQNLPALVRKLGGGG